MPVPLVRATPALSRPVVPVVPVGLIPLNNPGGGGMPVIVVGIPVVGVPVVGVPVVGVVVLGGVVLVLVELLVPAWLNRGKQEEY